MFASGFIVNDRALQHLKGEDKLATFSRQEGISTGNTVTNHFCSVCGTLMYRRSSGFPGMTVPRIGTVDNLELHSTKLKPKIEQFAKDRVEWLHAGEGVQQVEADFFTGEKE
ncbi:hypothetical protein LTR10_007119 [Elasticomyces elasticus]|nr:hypothetical protein LTR10_007119 [Elasticomyces elasticus]KAK4978936.1 hypothetical protein LTR42_001436 [Elasticomyces elasticus]